MNTPKTALKTNLVQSLEEIQEVNEMLEVVSIMESYINYDNCIIRSMAVPYDVLKGGGEILSFHETSIAMFPDKPALIKIDTTK